MKDAIKVFLEKKGWFIRKQKGLNIGINFFYDLEDRFGIRPSNIFDVGAHKGESISSFIKYYPLVKITAFEPIKSNFAVLKSDFGNMKNIKLENVALSNIDSEIKIILQDDSQTNSLRNVTNDQFAITEIIKTTTLDNYFKDNEVENIDILKINVEGFEKQVLEGSGKIIGEKRIKSIFLECSLDPNDNTHSGLIELQEFLRMKNFELAGIYDQVFFKDPVRLAYFNAFFILK